MPRTVYKVWGIGPAVGIGATGSIHIGLSGIAKRATSALPYVVANELICNQIARALLLPCPPGALMEKDGETYFFSLDFNLAGMALPPACPQKIVLQNPVLAWGIILFDALVMNEDRHTGNIAHDQPTGKIQIFDHSHALGGPSGDLGSVMPARANRLSIGGHCLASAIDTPDGFALWCGRSCTLADSFIEEVMEAACQVGIPSVLNKSYCAILKRHRDSIAQIVRSNLASFPKLPNGAL